MKVDYYEENVFLYAVDEDENIFQLRTDGSGLEWRHVVKGSPTWDAIHQGIFRNHRAHKLRPQDVPPGLPPLPEAPQGPAPPWESYFAPAEPIQATRFPLVAQLLEAAPAHAAEVTVVLHEDTWESSYGDGKFLYAVHACLSEDAARSYAEAHAEGYSAYHNKALSIKLDGAHIVFPDFKLQFFERCEQEGVLAHLEKSLATP